MRLDTGLASPQNGQKLREILQDTKNLAVRTIDNVHKIIFDLRPSIIDDLGLTPALRWYAENRLEALGIKTRIEVTGEERKLPPQIEIALFRAVQEAITNIAKHAEARNAILSIEYKDCAIGIEVEDDGKGFDVNAVSIKADKAQGLGLLGMNERITLLGGKFEIASEVDRGTRIIIEVPLNQ